MSVEFHMADGVFIRQIAVAEEGSLIPQHAHVWDHTTMVARGAVFVWKDGVADGRYDAPTGLLIKAGVKHSFRTLAPDTLLYCIHNLHGAEAVAVLAEHEFTPDEVSALLREVA